MIKLISIEIPVTAEYRSLWSTAKGYSATVTTFNAETGKQETKPNTETSDEFFEKTLKQDLISLAINPINNMIYQQINKEATQKIEEFNSLTQENLLITFSDVN